MLMFFKNPQGKCHWCAIPDMKSLSRFVSTSISKHREGRRVCTNCIRNTFRTANALEEHQKLCLENKPQVLKLPRKNTKISFKNIHKQMRVPFAIYGE